METFKLIHSSVIYDRFSASEYTSNRTGLTIIIAEVDGPLVTGRICVATPAFNDEGLPSALKRLILLGSEEFPQNIHKVIVNQCIGYEITVECNTDHTTYSIETVGAQGMLNALPILIKYLLYPLLREEDYKIQVHRVTKDGNDAGEMFSDLQNLEENFQANLHATVLKHIYSGRCSYAWNVKGTTVQLQESTNIDKVRNYHKEFYRPENLQIILAGNIDPHDVFRALQNLEEKIVTKEQRSPFQNPLQTPPPPLTESVKDLVIKYPSNNIETGYFRMAWRSAPCVKESYTILAIATLLEYLTESSIAPLSKAFVEGEDAYATRVSHDVTENTDSCMYISFDGVPVDKLPEIRPTLQHFFKKIIENEDIDMNFLKTVIRTRQLKEIIYVEHDAPQFVVVGVIENYVVYREKDDFQHCVNPLAEMNKLLEEPRSFWLNLLRNYFIDNKYVALQFKPSEKEKINIESEKEVNQHLTENLTRVDINEKGDLDNPAEQHERKSSLENISLSIPSLESIKFISMERYSSDIQSSDHNQRIDLSQTSLFTYFGHVKTSTVFIQALLDTSAVPLPLQMYLPIFFEALMEVPIDRDGILLPHDEVEKQLEIDTIYRWTDARSYNMPHMAAVTLEVENNKFEIGLKLLKELLYNTVFTVDRLTTIAKKHCEFLEGSVTEYDVMYRICYSKDSNIVINGRRQQHKFLRELIDKLDSDNSEEVLKNIEELRKIITEPSKVYLYIVGNLDDLKNPVEVINTVWPPESVPIKKQKLNPVFHHNFLEFSDSLNGCVIGINSEDDTAFSQATKCIISYTDPDYPALCLYTKYLDSDAGYLCGQIQNLHVSLSIDVEEGLLYLRHRAPKDIFQAYKNIKELITKQLENNEWDQPLLESVRRSVLYEIIEEESTISNMVLVSRTAFLHGLDYTYCRERYDLVKNVTTEDVQRVGQKYVAQLFIPEKSKTAVITHPSEVNKIVEEFKKLGFDLTGYASPEESFFKELYHSQ